MLCDLGQQVNVALDQTRLGDDAEAVALADPELFYGSTHQWPLYPGTGSARQHGPAGNIVNTCLPAGAGGPEFRHAVQTHILPALERFDPELVLISAGFDAHFADPLAELQLVEDDRRGMSFEGPKHWHVFHIVARA